MSFLLHLILHLIMLIEASEHTLEGKIDAEFNRIRLLKYKSGANCVKNNEKAYMIGFLYGNYYAPYRNFLIIFIFKIIKKVEI